MATQKQIEANRQNAKKAGRKPGTTPAVIERDAALKAFRDKVAQQANNLFRHQYSLAAGAQYLFRIDKEWIKTGTKKGGEETGYFRSKKPVLVESPEEMLLYLTEIVDKANGDIEDEYDESAAYYFLSARDPNNHAIDSMLDRTFGRAKSELDVNVNLPTPIFGGQSQLPPAKKAIAPKKVKSVVIHENGQKTVEKVAE